MSAWRAFEPAGRDSRPAGRTVTLARRNSDPVGRAINPPIGKTSESAEKASDPAGSALLCWEIP